MVACSLLVGPGETAKVAAPKLNPFSWNWPHLPPTYRSHMSVNDYVWAHFDRTGKRWK
jgi:hypothetical protein